MTVTRAVPPRVYAKKTEGVDADEFAKLQENYEPLLKKLVDNPLFDGQLLQGVALTAASNVKVEHKLGRKYVGWFITKKTVADTYPDDVTPDSDKASFLELDVSSDETVDIYVF